MYYGGFSFEFLNTTKKTIKRKKMRNKISWNYVAVLYCVCVSFFREMHVETHENVLNKMWVFCFIKATAIIKKKK